MNQLTRWQKLGEPSLSKRQLKRKRKFKQLIKLYPLFLIVFMLTSSCEEEIIDIQKSIEVKKELNFSKLSNRQKINRLKANLKYRVKSYNKQSNNNFIKKHGSLYLDNHITLRFKEIDNNFIVIIPFKKNKNKILIAYYKNGEEHYKIVKNKRYIENKKHSISEYAFIQNLDIIFDLLYQQESVQNTSVENKVNCTGIWMFDVPPCTAVYINSCTDAEFEIDTCGKGGDGDGEDDVEYDSEGNPIDPNDPFGDGVEILDDTHTNIDLGPDNSEPDVDPIEDPIDQEPDLDPNGCDEFEFDCDFNPTTPDELKCPEGQVRDINNNCIKKPCTGNPVKNPIIAPQTNSGVKGGMFGKNRNLIVGVGTTWHYGIDIKNEFGNPIFAMHDGIATLKTQYKNGKVDGAGYYVEVSSTINYKNVKILYFHMQKGNRISGQVKAGDIIGYQGNSGNLKAAIDQGLSESHVHIKTKLNGKAVDPNIYLKTNFNTDTGEILNHTNCN